MSRLYLRIYLSVLGSLLVFALLAGLAAIAFRFMDDEPGGPWLGPETGSEIAERLLPTDRSPDALEAELRYWQEKTNFSLILLSPSGETIAQAGDVPRNFASRVAKDRHHRDERRLWRGWRGAYGVTFDDGRQLVAFRQNDGLDWFRHLRWLAALIGIGLAVGIAAYPMIRHLTRRLERLETGVAAFGGGDLSARVSISGRDEIARLAATFNASADRIEALLNAHKQLLANASHELRSPLSRLRMAVEGGAGAADEMEIRRNIEELDALIEEILLSSRLQADIEDNLRKEPVDLVGLLAEECAAYGAELSVTERSVPTVFGDRRLLKRLFRNLLENAARHGGTDPADVTLSLVNGAMSIAVCDRGPGIPEVERERIFEPFYRLGGLPESRGGTGLGLALVKQIVERHAGTVECRARDGGGACFDIRLPTEG